MSEDDGIRVHVWLAQVGLGSRREVEGWIKHGYVRINDKPAKLGQKITPGSDEITVRGRRIQDKTVKGTVVMALNKPRGVVSTVKDPQGRPTIMNLIPKEPRVFPVGRLDLMSEGIILLTNDGELALRCTHPRYEVPKLYEVKIRGNLDSGKIDHLKKGVTIGDEKAKGAEIHLVREATREGVKKFIVRLTVYEGKNHHVRKMFEAIKCRVIKLRRLSIGPVVVKGLARGAFRFLNAKEIQKLRTAVGLKK